MRSAIIGRDPARRRRRRSCGRSGHRDELRVGQSDVHGAIERALDAVAQRLEGVRAALGRCRRKLVGGIGSSAAAGPSPSPRAPWHCTQLAAYVRAPSSPCAAAPVRLRRCGAASARTACASAAQVLRRAGRATPASPCRRRRSTARRPAGPRSSRARRGWSGRGRSAAPPGAVACRRSRRGSWRSGRVDSCWPRAQVVHQRQRRRVVRAPRARRDAR